MIDHSISREELEDVVGTALRFAFDLTVEEADRIADFARVGRRVAFGDWEVLNENGHYCHCPAEATGVDREDATDFTEIFDGEILDLTGGDGPGVLVVQDA